MSAPYDVLAIGPHPDDVEIFCGGTVALMVRQKRQVAILDLTQGEMGTRGSAELRAQEAETARIAMGVHVRQNLGLPDAGITNDDNTRAALVQVIRQLRPRVVIAPAPRGRHPDHRRTTELVRDACFLAGLKRYAPGDHEPFRPFKLLHVITYREDYTKPTFVVNITAQFERKLNAIKVYGSQFDGTTQAGEVYPNGEPLYDMVRHHAAHYGSLIRAQYGEPFFTDETMDVADVTSLGVSTF
jgi:bacillithiol biosynthesis deacetylase BshB1